MRVGLEQRTAAVAFLAGLVTVCGCRQERAGVGLVSYSRQRDGKTLVLSFDVMDKRPQFRVDLNQRLVLWATQEMSVNGRIGWELQVYEKPVTENSHNLLAPEGNWHGPQGHMFMAWMLRQEDQDMFGGTSRVLQIRGYGGWLEAELVDGAIGALGDSWRFTRGHINVHYVAMVDAN